MIIETIVILAIIFILSYFSTKITLQWANGNSIVDDPAVDLSRKKHKKPIPLMGATGFILLGSAVTAVVWLIAKFDIFGLQELLYRGLYQPVSYAWVLVSIMILLIAGYLDDTAKISTIWRFILTGIAILITVFLAGLKVEALSFPFDTIIPVFPLLPELLAFLWIGFCLFTTKVLDGHDGLVTSVGVVGFLTIASVATFSNVDQPLIILFGLIWAVNLFGFLPFNFPNAKLYLGDGGSMIIGYMIGVLSIMAGAKIATAGSVIGWFVIDLLFVWLRRVMDGRNPLTSSDRFHWHQRLADSGLSKIQVLAITMLVVLTTSRIGLMVSTPNKLFVLISQGVVLLAIFGITYSWTSYKLKSTKH
jgi:UDP-GlcNAc:undecaprenyl-phosphate GlcNAc-1-phosphate transferase